MEKKVIELGFYDSGTGKHQSNTVYFPKGMMPTMTTIGGGTYQIKVLRKVDMNNQDDIILGTNERDYYTRSDRQHRQAEQRQHESAECQGISTGIEVSHQQRATYGGKKTEVIGLIDTKGYEIANRVYSNRGVSPTVTTYQGGNREPKVVKKWQE